jgi:hypothetical protein
MGFWRRAAAARAINSVLPAVILFRRAAWVSLALAVSAALSGYGVFVGFLLLLPAVVLPLFWLMPLYMAWGSRALPALQSQNLTFAADGVEVESGPGKGILRWGAVTRFVETKRFLLLFTSSQCACAIPKVAIGDPAVTRKLAEFIKERLSATDSAPLTSSADPEGVLLVAEFTTDVREVYHAVMAASRHGPALWPAYMLMLAVVGWTTIAPLWRRWQAGDLANASISVTLLGLFPLILILSIRPLASLWAAHRHVKTNRSASGVQRHSPSFFPSACSSRQP